MTLDLPVVKPPQPKHHGLDEGLGTLAVSVIAEFGRFDCGSDDFRGGPKIHIRYPQGDDVLSRVFAPLEASGVPPVGNFVEKPSAIAQPKPSHPDGSLPGVEVLQSDEVNLLIEGSVVFKAIPWTSLIQ